MRLAVFVIRRCALIAVVLTLVSVAIFLIAQVLPGDVTVMVLGNEATEQDRATLRQKLGLNRPLYVRYLSWVGGVIHGDLGESLSMSRPVGPILAERLKNSAVLAVLALVVAVPVSLVLGVISGVLHDRAPDYLISIVTLLGVSLPEFVWGNVLIFALAYKIHLLPPSSLDTESTNPLSAPLSLVLPVITLTIVMLAHMTRQTRASMIEVLRSNYVRTAVLKGVSRRTVIFKHALRNALLPTVTIIAINIGWLMGSLVIVESVFSYNGLGRLMVYAVTYRDVTLLQATVLVVAAIYAFSNLAADIAYAILNPRIRV